MRAKISNSLSLSVSGVDFTTISEPEFYIKQASGLYLEYVPVVVSSTELLVTIPLVDAMKLKQGTADVQLAFKDSDGNPLATDVLSVYVKTLLKEAGYA